MPRQRALRPSPGDASAARRGPRSAGHVDQERPDRKHRLVGQKAERERFAVGELDDRADEGVLGRVASTAQRTCRLGDQAPRQLVVGREEAVLLIAKLLVERRARDPRGSRNVPDPDLWIPGCGNELNRCLQQSQSAGRPATDRLRCLPRPGLVRSAVHCPRLSRGLEKPGCRRRGSSGRNARHAEKRTRSSIRTYRSSRFRHVKPNVP